MDEPKAHNYTVTPQHAYFSEKNIRIYRVQDSGPSLPFGDVCDRTACGCCVHLCAYQLCTKSLCALLAIIILNLQLSVCVWEWEVTGSELTPAQKAFFLCTTGLTLPLVAH